MVEGRAPKFLVLNLAKIEVPIAAYPNIFLGQIPPASASFRGIPSPRVLRNLDNMLYGWGRAPKFLIIILATKLDFRVLISQLLASASFRELPWTSVSAFLG